MLNVAAAKVYLCVAPTDLRKSYDTLAAVVRDHLRGDPLSGSWFVFRGKRGDRLKILYWDGDGYAIWQKRLEQGTFEFPTATAGASGVEVRARDLALILGGIDLGAKRRKRYSPPPRVGGE
jgi:transposase